MDFADRVRSELEGSGYKTRVFESPQGTTVAFEYTLESGSLKGTTVWVGVSAPDGEYPEYPPHWLHVSPPINDQKGGSCNLYQDSESNEWLAMSRPPSDFWDRLPTKHMGAYIAQHVRRIWKDI